MKIDKKKHGKQLTIRDLLVVIRALKLRYGDDFYDVPIYIGNDEELNGIHCAYFRNICSTASEEPGEWREIISEDSSNIELGDDEVALLIS